MSQTITAINQSGELISTAEILTKYLKGMRSGNGFVAKCPAHDDRRPSLSINDQNGKVLVRCHAGCSQLEVLTALRKLGLFLAQQATVLKKPAEDSASFLWSQSMPPDAPGSELLWRYLQHRGLPHNIVFDNVRFHKGLFYREHGLSKTLPALVCRIVDQSDCLIGINRIYLDSDGRKASVSDPKKILGRLKGGAVRLRPAKDGIIAVCEGVETGLAIQFSSNIPVWAALTATNLKAIDLPPDVRLVYIYADIDESGVGQDAAIHLADRLHGEGIRTFVVGLGVQRV